MALFVGGRELWFAAEWNRTGYGKPGHCVSLLKTPVSAECTRTQKLIFSVRGSMDTMTLNGDHDTDEIRAELARICDQFREGLLATVVPLCASQQAPPGDEEAEQTRRMIEKIKAKDFISVEEAALLFGCSEQHLRNQLQKAIDGTAVHPIPFADLDGVVRFPWAEVQEWASLPKPRPGGKSKRRKNERTHLSAVEE